MALMNCSECGNRVSSRAITCPNCGCPVDISLEVKHQKRRLKLKRIVITTILLVFLIITIFLVIKHFNRPNIDGYYVNTKWGMTIEQVQNKLKGKSALSKDNLAVTESIKNYEDIEGVDALVLYDCDENSLHKVSIYLTNSGESSYTDSRLIEKYENKFNELYKKENEDDIGTCWKAKKSKVKLIYLSDGLIVITYEDTAQEDK